MLEQLSVLGTRTKGLTRLTKSSKIFKAIINAIEEKKGEQIVSLDLRKIPEAVADFFIICQAPSTTQVKAIADFIEFQVKEVSGEDPYKHEGKTTGQWVLVDYVNIVVHVMHPEARRFYSLEDMWSDAVLQKHE
ncbi:ribosome silencing factor [Parasediminibacterium sp. JCM 36343]|uniref:ribosome silencing factor n=1 Tax=Parasediminibacterium sp. JCM 36343 TaxID=3374279 RepID=UPI00397E615B